MRWREDTVEQAEEHGFDVSLRPLILKSLFKSRHLDTIRELRKGNPGLFYDLEDSELREYEESGITEAPQVRLPLSVSLLKGALRSGDYARTIVLANRYKDSFEGKDLESLLTIAVDNLGSKRCKSRSVKRTVDRMMSHVSFLCSLCHTDPRLATALLIDLDQYEMVAEMEERYPFDVMAAYQDEGMLKESARLARSLLSRDPMKVMRELDHPDLYNFRLCLIDEILTNKVLTENPLTLGERSVPVMEGKPVRKGAIYQDNPDCFGEVLDAIGEPDVFDDDRRTFQEHLYMMIATGAQAKDPWTAYRAAKYLKPIRPKLFHKMRSNLIRRMGISDTELLIDEFYTDAEYKDDEALIELGERLCEVNFHPDRASILHDAIFCFRQVDKLPSSLTETYKTALIELVSLNQDVVLYHDEVEYVSSHIAQKGNPFTAYQLLQDYEPTDVTREILHKLSIRFQTRWGHLDRAIDCEVAALEGVEDPDYTHLAELFHEQEELNRRLGYDDLRDNDWNLR